MGGILALVVLLILIVIVLFSCIKIVPQAQAYVVERLGAYQGTWSVGLHIKVPFLDRVAKRVNLRNTPEIIFELDDSLEYGARIDNILKENYAKKRRGEII